MRVAVRMLSVAISLVALGCDGTGPAKLVATYALVSVDGVTVPRVIQTTPLRVELTAERVMLYDDGRFVERTDYLEGIGSGSKTTTSSTRGKWEKAPSGFILHFKVPEFFIGFRECERTGDTVTCSFGIIGSPLWIYRLEESSGT